jgi:hypothetical protein
MWEWEVEGGSGNGTKRETEVGSSKSLVWIGIGGREGDWIGMGCDVTRVALEGWMHLCNSTE